MTVLLKLFAIMIDALSFGVFRGSLFRGAP